MNLHVIDSFRGEYRFLSNFYESPLTLPDGRIADTLEHGFQAYKAVYDEDYERILNAPSPGEAKRLGRQVRLRLDWESAKIPLMRRLLAWKFDEGALLARRLLDTENALLVEDNTWGDTFWGVYDGVGHNWLGHLLMARRAELRAAYVRNEENP